MRKLASISMLESQKLLLSTNGNYHHWQVHIQNFFCSHDSLKFLPLNIGLTNCMYLFSRIRYTFTVVIFQNFSNELSYLTVRKLHLLGNFCIFRQVKTLIYFLSFYNLLSTLPSMDLRLFLPYTKVNIADPIIKLGKKNIPYRVSVNFLYYFNRKLKLYRTLLLWQFLKCYSNFNYNFLSVFSKLYEKVMYKRLYAHFTKHGFLSDCQSGFRKGHLTVHAMQYFLDFWIHQWKMVKCFYRFL